MKGKIFSLVVIATFLFTITTVAQPGERNRRMNQELRIKRHQNMWAENQPFFTAEQKDQVKKIRLETAQKLKPLRNELRELMAHQQTLTTADDAKMKAISSNIEKMSGVKTEMAKIRAAQHQEIRSLLDEEQLLQFDQHKQKMGRGRCADIQRKNHKMSQRNGMRMNG